MKNSFGNSISLTVFGESHGEAIGVVLDGLTPGIKLDYEYIDAALTLRRPSGKISTPRKEKDEYKIVSGVFNGYTTGTPIAIIIENENVKSADYSEISRVPRPSHADFAAECKYHGFQDYRGGGHFSGRITAPIVAAGAILRTALKNRGIYIGTHISELMGIMDEGFSDYESDIDALNKTVFPTISEKIGEEMISKIESAREAHDSVGGVLETAVIGMPCGVGEPFFDSVESIISHLLFSVGGVKGVEFGLGFGFKDKFGSEANDEFCVSDGKIETKTNNNGGINGGITNGMPLIIKSAVKPTPSIFKEQQSVNLDTMESVNLKLSGRHDAAIIHRARAVVDALIALGLCDLLAMRYGTDYFKGV